MKRGKKASDKQRQSEKQQANDLMLKSCGENGITMSKWENDERASEQPKEAKQAKAVCDFFLFIAFFGAAIENTKINLLRLKRYGNGELLC